MSPNVKSRFSYLARDCKVHYSLFYDSTMRFCAYLLELVCPRGPFPPALSRTPDPPRFPFCPPHARSPPPRGLPGWPRAPVRSGSQGRNLVCRSACGAAMAGHIGYNRSISPRPSTPSVISPVPGAGCIFGPRWGLLLGEGFNVMQDGELIGNERWHASLLHVSPYLFPCAGQKGRRA